MVARVLTQPPMSPEAVAAAEAALEANPGDFATRMRLLTHYAESFPIPPNDDPVKRAARLAHIAYFVEHQPATINAASPLFYVFRSGGHYANAADHEMIRGLWIRHIHATDSRIVVNAARFLFVENKQEAEQLLRRAVESSPDDRRLAANLGFLYAMQVLGLDSFGGVTSDAPAAEREDARRRAESELESSSNALVLAGAATAIPNLSVRASRGRPVDPELFQLSSRLMAKARVMAPSDEALRGPMPLIEYFQEAQGLPRPAPSAPTPGARIRVGFAVQRAKLVEAPQPKYPEPAQKAAVGLGLGPALGAEGALDDLPAVHPLLHGHEGGAAGQQPQKTRQKARAHLQLGNKEWVFQQAQLHHCPHRKPEQRRRQGQETHPALHDPPSTSPAKQYPSFTRVSM